MQENRAFDHYYGTMAGVRGFKDPNAIKIGDGNKTNFYQPCSSLTSKAEYLLPWYLSEDQSYAESNQCMTSGSNDWSPNLNAWNNGSVNGWVEHNTPYSWGYFKRSDIPTHFGIVEGWTVGDMYSESVIGPTNPNRVTWASGTINVPGSPPGEGQGGPYIENHESNGCLTGWEGQSYACYPLKWKTVPEYLEEAGVDWYVYQDENNFDDNPLAWFEQYQDATNGTALYDNGVSFSGLEKFYEDAANGNLPAVSYIVGPKELSEHPPWQPRDGAWLQQRVVDAVVNSPSYNNTALLISYDETGGWGDHVPPFVSPNGTEAEWFEDPEQPRYVPSGPGFRVPFYVISPWTRGGRVYTAPSDHNSQILFLEEWAAAALDKPFTVDMMNPWRRQNMDDLVGIFDFENPDYSIPDIKNTSYPLTSGGSYTGETTCALKYGGRHPSIPYGSQDESSALYTESGYKQIRGDLTEGRYLVFRSKNSGQCLTVNGNQLTYSTCADNYDAVNQRFVVYQMDDAFSKSFSLQSVQNGQYYGNDLNSVSSTSHMHITFHKDKGYKVGEVDDEFDILSVTY